MIKLSKRRAMYIQRTSGSVIVAVLAASLLASAASSAPVHPDRPSAGDRSMMAAMQSMKPVTARTKLTGDIDRDFMTMMIPHHDAGITMSQAQVRYGKHPQLRKMAAGDVKDQRKDNASMHQYLRGWRVATKPVASGSPSTAMLNDMREMDAATARMKMTGNQDRDFIEMMIPHHEAAIEMARTEMQSGRDARVKKVAKGIFDGQSKDVKDMKSWYQTWYGRPYSAA